MSRASFPSVTLCLHVLSLGDLLWSCDVTIEHCDPGSYNSFPPCNLPSCHPTGHSVSAWVAVRGLWVAWATG